MINQKASVYSKLSELEESGDSKQVCESYPADWSKLPAITYYEVNNAEAENADDEEYTSNLGVQIDVWGETSSVVSALTLLVNNKMKELGYQRTLCLDIPDSQSTVKHKTMRFEKEE